MHKPQQQQTHALHSEICDTAGHHLRKMMFPRTSTGSQKSMHGNDEHRRVPERTSQVAIAFFSAEAFKMIKRVVTTKGRPLRSWGSPYIPTMVKVPWATHAIRPCHSAGAAAQQTPRRRLSTSHYHRPHHDPVAGGRDIRTRIFTCSSPESNATLAHGHLLTFQRLAGEFYKCGLYSRSIMNLHCIATSPAQEVQRTK